MHEYLLTFDGISVAIGNDCIYMWINSKRCNVCESAGCHRTHINDAHYSTQILFHRFFISFFFSLLLQSHSFWLKQDTCTMLIEIYGGCAPPAAGGNLFDNVLHWRVAEYIFYKTISIKCYTVCVVLCGVVRCLPIYESASCIYRTDRNCTKCGFHWRKVYLPHSRRAHCILF